MISTYPQYVQDRINRKVEEIKPALDLLPGVVLISDLRDSTIIYANQCALTSLGVSLKELQDMGTAYHERFFRPEDAKDFTPKMIEMIERNDPAETCTLFQQVKYADGNWHWHLTSFRLFLQDDEGNPVAFILTSQLISAEQNYWSKVDRLLNELNFLRANIHTYYSLSNREREVFGYMAKNRSSTEIAEKLFISVSTVETHRKNIRRKLNIKNERNFGEYARAFELI